MNLPSASARQRAPGATYRLQFGPAFGFNDATRVLDYLAALGVTDCYASPLLAARSGSTHGYDVIDPTRLNAELGSDQDFERLHEAMVRHHMGLLLDFVPNHMCIGCNDNYFWHDVLRNGRASRFARWFDVYWDDSDRFLVPLLGRNLDDVVADGELGLVHQENEWFLSYFEQRFPLSEAAQSCLTEALAAEGAGRTTEERLRAVVTPSFMHRLLALLPYRLVHWRTAERRPAYRRFFTINELIGLRIEDPEVFRVVHQKVFELIANGSVTGLRIDHIDGLQRPRKYLQDLRRASSELLPDGDAVYVVVEKILGEDERLPDDWVVDGTTGYEFLNAVLRLFVHDEGADALRRTYAAFIGRTERFQSVAQEAKRFILSTSLRGDAERLVARIGDPLEGTSREELSRAVAALLGHLHVYRTYWEPGLAMSEPDQRRLAAAFDDARAESAEIPGAAFDVLWSILLGGAPIDDRVRREFVLRFQQLSGPAAAKGIEDTALYRYFPLSALNEVGGDPDARGMAPVEFHAFNRDRLRWPRTLSATSTHDTKRGEDVRLRIAALSEIPDAWAAALARFRIALDVAAEERPEAADEYLFYQTVVGTLSTEDAANVEEYSLRIEEYMIKAIREAHVHTSWQKPDETYERRMSEFVRHALLRPAFMHELLRFVEPIATSAAYSSIAQAVLKIASPGVPDFYQGTELYELSLVDPDNRRPIDFERRRRLLGDVTESLGRDVRAAWRRWIAPPADERLKIAVISRALALRRRHRDLFDQALYLPLLAAGDRADHVVCFARVHGEAAALAVVARWHLILGAPARLPVGAIWLGTTIQIPRDLPHGTYRDAFTAATVRIPGSPDSVDVAQLLEQLPVALLERIS